MVKDKQIYKKIKEVDIDLTPSKKLRVTVSHEDLRHSMKLSVIFTPPELIIDDICCDMTRYPHEECHNAKSALKVMVGYKVVPGIVKIARESVSDQGCTHLNNLFQEACYAVIQGHALYRRQLLEKLLPGLDIEQTNKIMIMLRPELVNSCVSFTPSTSFMRAVKKTRLPCSPDRLKEILNYL